MGHGDTCCAICGAVAGQYYHEECDLQEGLEETEVDWTTEVRVIGLNQSSTSLDKTYISGRAREPSQGEYPLEAGSHPNDPVASGEYKVQVYDPGAPRFPVHVLCLEEILSSVLHFNCPELDNSGQIGKWGNISLSQLYRCFRGLWTNDLSGTLTKIYYGEIEERRSGQGFRYEEGDQDFIADPVRYKDIDWSQWIGAVKDTPPSMGAPSTDSDSHLLRMPLDILYEICLRLDLEWVASLQQTCRMLSRIPFPRWYWLQRVKVDFSYLEDTMERLWQLPSVSMNWQRVHQGLCGITSRKSPTRIPALVNRGRIWDICQNIVAEYMAYPDVHGQLVEILGSAYNHVSVPRMPLIAFPESLQDEEFVVFLGEAPDFVPDGPIEISASFGEGDLISNMHVEGATCDVKLDDDDDFTAQGAVQLSETDNIERVIFVCKAASHLSSGAVGMIFQFTSGESKAIGKTVAGEHEDPLFKRILKVTNGHRLIGFKGTMLPGFTISRFGLIELETNFQPVMFGAEDSPVIDSVDSIQKFMWSDEPPPDNTHVGPLYYSANGNPAPCWDMIQNLPFAHISFVKSGWHLEEVSIDMRLQGLETKYRSGSETSTHRHGPRFEEHKTLRLDCQRGEHIVSVGYEAHHSDRPRMIRIRTSLNRQMVWGSQDAGETNWFEHSDDYSILGMYCAWENFPWGATLLAYGLTYSPSESPVCALEEAELSDEENAIWEPRSPPFDWKPQGPIIGVDTLGPRDGRRRVSVVSWLDFSRPVEKIRLCFTHSQETTPEAISLVGVSVSYNNGSRCLVGLMNEGKIDHPEPPTLSTPCECRSINQTTRHWRFEEFDIRGVAITCLRVWSNTEIYALQIVLENEQESPIWGDEKKGKRHDFSFGADRHKGVKLFFWSLHRSIGITDLSVAALQGLG